MDDEFGADEPVLVVLPGAEFSREQAESRRQRESQSQALATRHAAESLDLRLEASLRTSLNMDSWPARLIFAIKIEDVGDFRYEPWYPSYYQDEIFAIEYGTGDNDGLHTMHRWMNRHQRELRQLSYIERAMQTGEFRADSY